MAEYTLFPQLYPLSGGDDIMRNDSEIVGTEIAP